MHIPRVTVRKGDGRVKVAKPVPWEREREMREVSREGDLNGLTWFCPGQVCFVEMSFTITANPFAIWSI